MAEDTEGAKVAFDSLGCKLNQAEMESLARQFAEAGYRIVSPSDKADIYILNTCTVTHVADRKSRQLLRMAHRRNPDTRLVVTGCYAERSPQDLAGFDGVDLIISNEQKPDILRILEESGRIRRPAGENLTGISYNSGRTRSFIRIQDGCSKYCAYCVVPLVRREEMSVPVEQVIDGIRARVAEGCREVVLTGTEVGSYRSNGVGITGLLRYILSGTGISRLRLSSLQPRGISPAFIGLWHDERLCPHFHLSLQSGSGGVLGRMKRLYTVADYHHAVSLIREVVPDAAITTDIIVGFPGETEAEYQDSLSFCRQMEFARIHVFTYSLRKGTEAASMQQLPDKIKRQRSREMLALADESALRFRQRFTGRTLPVLWEKQDKGVWSGLTGSYIRVYTRTSEDLTGKLLPVKLVEIERDGVWGEIL